MNEPVTIRFVLTIDEYVHGVQALMRRSPGFWIGPVFGAVIVVVGAYAGDAIALVWGSLVLILAGVSWRVVPKMRWRQTPMLTEEQEHVFDDSGVTVRIAGLENHFRWDFYARVAETPWLYLMLRRRQGNFLPKRAFPSAEDEARFRALVREKLNSL